VVRVYHLCCLYGGVVAGVVYHVSEGGAFVQVLQAEGAILRLLQHQQRQLLVVITDALVLAQFSTDADGAVREISKVWLTLNRGIPDLFLSRNLIHLVVRFWP
jgi:hypothetical protein